MKSIILTLLFGVVSITTHAQYFIDSNSVDPNFHLYILMGQSNMAGRGDITDEYKNEGSPQVFMLDKNNQWVPAHHPLHFDKPIAGVGPGLAFGISMANDHPGIKIGLIPCAVGGTSILAWQPGGYDSATNKYPYDDAVARISKGMKAGVVKGMLWHQGETDSKPDSAILYLPRLKTLIERVRTLTHNPSLPVVAGELGRYKEQNLNINNELKKLPSLVSNTAVASSEGLVHKGDGSHLSSASAEKLGECFAVEMKRLQSNMVKGKAKKKRKP